MGGRTRWVEVWAPVGEHGSSDSRVGYGSVSLHSFASTRPPGDPRIRRGLVLPYSSTAPDLPEAESRHRGFRGSRGVETYHLETLPVPCLGVTRPWDPEGAPPRVPGCDVCRPVRPQVEEVPVLSPFNSHVSLHCHLPHLSHVPHLPRLPHLPHPTHLPHLPHLPHAADPPRAPHPPHPPHPPHLPHQPHVPHLLHLPHVSHVPHPPRVPRPSRPSRLSHLFRVAQRTRHRSVVGRAVECLLTHWPTGPPHGPRALWKRT